VETIKSRAEYRAVAGGRRVSREGFVLQAQAADNGGPARFGFTVTKKIGNAVVRNRIRRRLKEAVRLAGAAQASAGTNYVIVGRRAALTLEFDRLVADLLSGLAALSRPSGKKRRSEKPADA
jgi:ribonuclease P protein component